MDTETFNDLRTAYLLTFDDFAIIPSDLVVHTEDRINLRYARELLGVLVTQGLVVTDENGEGEDVWQTYPDTYDNIDREEAIRRFDETFKTTTAKDKTMTKTAETAVHPCYCGCKENVPAKSFYRPGHDARHAGVVGRQIAANANVKGFDRRELLNNLPSERLVAKAEAIAEKAFEKAEATAKREIEKDAAKTAKANQPAKSKPKPKAEPEPETKAVTLEEGIVKIGKAEFVATRNPETGRVLFFKNDESREASKTAAATFVVG